MSETQTKDIEKFEDRGPAEVPAVQDSPNAVVMMAMQKGYEPALIEKMLTLQERFEANEARKAYFDAKAAFKAVVPTVIKDKDNKQYGSKYASENALINTMNPFLSQFGLEASFSFPEVETGAAVTCTLSHKLGHSESVTLKGPLDTSGSKNPMQQVKSSVTYLRKATFEAITGIASSDAESDDDGNTAAETITEDQHSRILDMIDDVGNVDEPAFLKYLGVDELQNIPVEKFSMAMKALKQKKKANEK